MIQLLCGATAIGLAPIFAKALMVAGKMNPITIGFWRMFIGAIGFTLMMVQSNGLYQTVGILTKTLKLAYKPLVVAGILFALDLAAWHTSFGHTSVAASALIANLSSVLVPLAGVLFFGEIVSKKIFLGGTIALAGVAGLILFRSGGDRDHGTDSLLLGEGLAFATAFFYTGYMITIKRIAGRFSAREIMLISSLLSAVVLCVISLANGENLMPPTPGSWVLIVGLGLISQVIGQGLVAKALAVVPVSQSALILLLAPTSSAIFGWIFLGEVLSVEQIIFMFLAILGITIVVRR